MKANQNSTPRQEACALLGNVLLKERFMTTSEVIARSSEVPALLKPKKLLGDYTVCAGEVGTPELTQNYLSASPGMRVGDTLNTIISKNLKESSMNTSYETDQGGKLKSFDEFPVSHVDFGDVELRAATPAIVTMDFKGNVIHQTLVGTQQTEPHAATTVEMNSAKERALKRMAEFVSSFHGNNQQSLYTKG